MKHVFTLFVFALMSSGLAQVPDYIPESGLIGWYPLDGNLESSIDSTQDGFLDGPVVGQDRFGNPNGALSFDGVDDFGTINHYSAFENCAEMTISVWVNPATYPSNVVYCGGGTGASYLFLRKWSANNESRTFAMSLSNWAIGSTGPLADGFLGFCNNGGCWGAGESNGVGSWSDVPVNSWTHLAYVIGSDSSWVYVNSEILYADILGAAPNGLTSSNNPIHLGRSIGSFAQCQSVLNGKLDDIGFWNRALTEEEILSLYLAEEQISGCTDPLACNFDPLATIDDGGCLFPPLVDLGIDTVTCEDIVVLDAGEGFVSYQWNTGENTQSIEAMISGEYGVTVVGAANSSNAFAMDFDGDNDLIQTDIPASELLGLDGLSIAVRFKWMGEDSDGGPQEQGILSNARSGNSQLDFGIDFEWPEGDRRLSLAWADMSTLGSNGMQYSLLDAVAIEPGVWYDVVVTLSTNSVKWYLDGELVEQDLVVFSELGQESDEVPSLRLGKANEIYDTHFNGVLDDLQFFTRTLTFEEAEGVFSCDANLDATGLIGHWSFDEGSGVEALDASPQGNDGNVVGAQFIPAPPASVCSGCVASDTVQVTLHHGGCFCGQGTIWDETTEQCIAIDNDPLPACGDGTVWDPVEEECIIVMPSDTDFDGCVSMVDLLGLLTVFGSCIEVSWECGDPLEYQGYDYETVQIGEQCWFAENLRSEHYENGDIIPSNLSDNEWQNTNSGATAVYGEGSSGCFGFSPDGDACDEAWSLNEYGRLYNWYAVDEARGLCPGGWGIPDDSDWTALTESLGGGVVASGKLKSTYGWGGDGNGSNSSGFSALPGGKRRGVGGASFYSAGVIGYWWSSSQVNESRAWHRAIYDFNDEVLAGDADFPEGYSVRCIRDAE